MTDRHARRARRNAHTRHHAGNDLLAHAPRQARRTARATRGLRVARVSEGARRLRADRHAASGRGIRDRADRNDEQVRREVTAALAAGARGYLVKDVEPEVLVAGIRAAVNGGAPLSPSVAAQLIRNASSQPNSGASLTQRERQILRLIVGGQSNKQIGRELGISEKTVKSHCGRLFQRINVSDRTQAAVWATKHLPPEDD